jgi:hypothetical protein
LVGPDAWYATGATIPVTTKSGEGHTEELTELVFHSTDDMNIGDYVATGLPLGLYKRNRSRRSGVRRRRSNSSRRQQR